MNNCKSRREFSDSHRGNGHTVTFEYDNLGRTKKVIYSGGPTLTYTYTGVLVVGYSYSAYGVVSAYAPLASVAAEPLTMNPLTYRGYVYDRETTLYYLQSRYYDPELGRFINADALVSTGQGVLGNNMFAYCLNNPTNHLDPTGKFTRRQIHDEVLREICLYDSDLVMTDTCVYYNGKDHKGKWGFCDLLNTKTGEVWELKRISTASSCQRSAARDQLGGYLCGCLKHIKELQLTEGKTKIPSGCFTRRDGNKSYYIWYWDSGDGIIYYDYLFTTDNDGFEAGISITGLVAEVMIIIALSMYYRSIGSGGSMDKTETDFGPFSNAA